jgi:hypothetical protein
MTDDITGLKVDVYRNLAKGGFSIRSRETETYGRVISHRDTVHLRDVEFVVREKGRQKVLEEEVKNVHAVLRGVVAEESPVDKSTEVTYNPYKYSNFVERDTEKSLDQAAMVRVSTEGVFAENVTYVES